jgi:regulation of enolase protein 1 (concanavalin A-like superfamily)
MRISIQFTRNLAVVLLLLIIGYSTISGQKTQESIRDGKLLRGEKWAPFSYPEKADFYVSPMGDDRWSGTLPEPNAGKTDGPFLTIERSQKAVRELKEIVFFPKDPPVEKRFIGSPHPFGRGKDILVYIRGGDYFLKNPLIFEPSDGGERVETNLPTGAFEYHKLKDHYVTYAAYPGERPVISGGIPVSDWRKTGKIWSARYDADTAAMLVADGKRQILARTPNEGYFIPPAISQSVEVLYFNKGDIRQWKEMEDNRVIMLLRWHTGINSIIKVDEKNGIATFRSPQEGVVIVPPRYYIENVKALLDAPGEWFFDKKRKEISYMPADDITDPNLVIATVPFLSRLVGVHGKAGQPVRNLRFYGLTFEGATAGSSLITYEFSHACEFAGCEIRSCNGTGISVKKGCYQIRIINNKFETIDNGGIYVNGPAHPGDGREIIRETIISHNKMYDCGGTNIGASYTLMTTISHNYITKTRGRFGIYVGGWANQEEAIDGGYVVEYNHLDDVQRDADDSGAITTAGLTFNSIVRRNLIHNVHAGFFNDNVGFWFDNMSSGWTVEENIFYNLEQGEMKLCAALLEDNIYRNNFIIEPPAKAPEMIIEGDTEFEKIYLKVKVPARTDPVSGSNIKPEDTTGKELPVFKGVLLDIAKLEIHQYCSAKAKPFEIEADATNNRFKITAGGSDFFHAEDSYAAVYLKGIKGDFVATVTISEFGDRTHEWFRSGIFVRNDIARSFDVQPGSKGSVLLFSSPGRAGINYDEFANGCMHKASSENLPENSTTPIYLKLIRHGNSFSGYISLDGKSWIIERHTPDIPGIAETIDLGLAAGGPDKQQYRVEFRDWKIQVAK